MTLICKCREMIDIKNWVNDQYRKNLEQYDKKDGLKALWYIV